MFNLRRIGLILRPDSRAGTGVVGYVSIRDRALRRPWRVLQRSFTGPDGVVNTDQHSPVKSIVLKRECATSCDY